MYTWQQFTIIWDLRQYGYTDKRNIPLTNIKSNTRKKKLIKNTSWNMMNRTHANVMVEGNFNLSF